MSRSPRSKQSRQLAIQHLAAERGVSYSVAAHILDCWSTDKRAKYVARFAQKKEQVQ